MRALLCGIAASGALLACATYHPRPLAPDRAAERYEARSLDDPELRKYVAAHLPEPLAEWSPSRLDLETLALVAFYFQPDLDVARAQVGLAEAGMVTAAGRPNPTVGFPLGRSSSMAAPWIYGVDFDIPIETAGKREHRIARAERLTEASRLALAETAWRVRSRVRSALVERLVAERERDALREESAARAEEAQLVEQRLTYGATSRPDLDTAQGELASAEGTATAAEGRATEARLALADAVGLPPDALDGVAVVWPTLDSPPSAEELELGTPRRAALSNRLDVRRSLADYDAFEATLRLEIAKQYPDLHLGPGYNFDDDQHKYFFGFSLELPVLNQNQGPIAEAEAARAEAEARFLALQARVIAEVELATSRYRSSLAELSAADRLVAALELQRAATAREVDVGQSDRLALTGILVRRAVAVRAQLAALRKTQTALGMLEDALQIPLGEPHELSAVEAAEPPTRAKKERTP